MKKEKSRAKATATVNLHHDEGEQIPDHEEFDSMLSDELRSFHDSSEEDTIRKKPRLVRFNLEFTMDDLKFHVGQVSIQDIY